MSRIAIALAVTLAAVVAVGAWIMVDEPTGFESPGPASTNVDENEALGDRIDRIEHALAEEREARQMLEEELFAALEQLEGLQSQGIQRRTNAASQISDSSEVQFRGRDRQRDLAAMMRNYEDRRIDGLVSNGYSEDEARRLLQLESEAQYKVMEAGYEARRNGERIDLFASGMNAQSIFRAELGDSEYERYLTAQGQPTAVQVASVLKSSPGSTAGLRPGDEIVSYNGERTYSMSELSEMTLQGEPGENVVVEIDRDGVRMQLSIPRGPIGMNGNGAAIRSMMRWGG